MKKQRLFFLIVLLELFSLSLIAEPMILIFDTTLSDSTEIALPLYGTVDVTVDWGDGNSDSYVTASDKLHTYANEGTYTVSVDGILTQFGGGDHEYIGSNKLTSITSFGTIGLTSLSGAFYNASNLTQVPSQLPSEITDLSYVFRNASSSSFSISSLVFRCFLEIFLIL